MHTTTQHRLKRGAKLRGITQAMIAKRAKVQRQHVCHVLNGTYKSRRVVAIVRLMIAEHDAATAKREGAA